MTDYTHHYCKTVEVAATAPALFAELDHHERLADHMMQSSAMMAGQRMRFEFDRDHGRRIGSKITMVGHMLGLDLIVEEVVLDRDPPRTKTWETVGNPQLLVIGSYRMGFTIEPRGPASRLTVFIDYRLPRGLLSIVGRLFGPMYARWCVNSMVDGAALRAASASRAVSAEATAS